MRKSPSTVGPSVVTSRCSRQPVPVDDAITKYPIGWSDDPTASDWPEPAVRMLRNWIGRSSGARVKLRSQARRSRTALATASRIRQRYAEDSATPEDSATVVIDVFTTRPDTLFGATFMVLAPEHPLVDSIVPVGDWPDGTREAWVQGGHQDVTPKEAVAAYRLAAVAQERHRAAVRGQRQDRSVHRCFRDQSR